MNITLASRYTLPSPRDPHVMGTLFEPCLSLVVYSTSTSTNGIQSDRVGQYCFQSFISS